MNLMNEMKVKNQLKKDSIIGQGLQIPVVRTFYGAGNTVITRSCR